MKVRTRLALGLFLVLGSPLAGAAVFTNIATQPASLPNGVVNSVDYSQDGTLMAVATTIGGYIFSISGNGAGATYSNLSFIAGAGTSGVNAIRFSPDSQYACIAGTASTGTGALKIASRGAGFGDALESQPPKFINASATDCGWSPDSGYFAVTTVAGNASALRIYTVPGVQFPSSYGWIPTNVSPTSTHALSWATGDYLAVGTGATPFFQVYNFSGDQQMFLAYQAPTNLPAASIGEVKFSSNGALLAIASFPGGAGTDFKVYDFAPGSTPVLSQHASLSGCAVNSAGGLTWVNDPIISYVALSCSTSSFRLYSLSGGTFTQITGTNAFDTGPFGTMHLLGSGYSGNVKNLVVGSSNRTMIYSLGTPNAPTAIRVTSQRVADNTGACQLVNWTAPSAGVAPTGYSTFLHTGDPVPSLTSPMNASGQWVYEGHVDATSLNQTTCHMTFAQDQWWAVAGTTAGGEGVPGGPSNNTTVSGPPSFVKATAGSTSLIVVNWSAGIAANGSATGWSVFSKVSPEGTPSYALNASGYSFAGHVDQPLHQFNVTSLTTNTTYCFRVESTNASAWGEGDISFTTACATTGNVTLPPVLSGVYVPCSTFALSWTLPNGTIDGYRIDQSTPFLPFVNRSFFVPPDGNFTLRQLNVSFPQISGELDYAAFAHSPAGYSASSNIVNFTPPTVSTIGDCGLQWGGTSASDFAAQAGITVSAAQVMVSIFLIVMGAGIGLVAMGNGAGVVGGVGAAMLLSVALGLIPTWAIMFTLVAGAALGVVGAVISSGQRALNRGGLGR